MGKITNSMLEDKKISIAIMSSFVVLTTQYLILVYFNLMNTNVGSIVQLTSKGIVGLLYLGALPSVLKRNKIKFIGVYFVAVFTFILNYAFYNENWVYLKTIVFPLFFTCLPSLLYAYSIKNWNVLMNVMKKASEVVLIVGTLIGILVFTGNVSVGRYSMSLSYYMLLPTIIYMNEFLDKFSLKTGLIVLLSLIIIIALGSRGAILCVAIFVILKFMGLARNLSYPKVLLFLIILTIVILGLIYMDVILECLYNILLNFGIRSRSIQLFLRDDLYLSGREKIYDSVIDEILDNPFLGIGLAGDRYILSGGYVHNIFIEIFANFGVVLGSLVIILLIYLIIKSLLVKESTKYNLITIWFSIGFVHLFVSSSYLTDFKFWILLGLVFKKYSNKIALIK